MPDISLSIASTGLDAAQTAMDTISQNLSNANTPGYVTETANLVANPGGDPLGVGDGTRVTSVTQTGDTLLVSNAQQAQASLAQSSALQQVLQQAQLSFQEPSTSGLAQALSAFWQSWDQVASNPSGPAGRQQVVDNAQNVATDLQQASAQMATTTANANSQLSGVVSTANTLLSEVAGLNQQITATTSTGGSPNSLLDQRTQLMGQLAGAIGATGTLQPDGSLSVTVGGISLVQGNWSDTLSLQTGGSGSQIVAKTSQATLAASSGTAAGLLAAVNQYLPAYQSQLDGVAKSLSSLVNGALTAGYTATGAAGTALFTGTGAANIGIDPAIAADPTLLAASGTSTLPDATNDGSNAQSIADLWNSPTGPDVSYQGLVQQVGDQVSSINSQVRAQTSVSNAATQNLQAVTGVNPNDQLVSLLNFQQAYQAAAKVISTADSAMQSLLAAIQ